MQMYQGPAGGVPIYLNSNDGHYNIITKMPGFLNRNLLCNQCKKGYDHKEWHACNNLCHFCRQLHDNKDEDWQYSKTCNSKYINPDCFM